MRADDFRIALELELIAHGYAPGRKPGEYVYPPNAHLGARRVFAGGSSHRNRASAYLDLGDAHGRRAHASSEALDAYLEEVLLWTWPGQVSGTAGASWWSVDGMRPDDLLTHLPAILRLGKLEVHRSLNEGATQ